MAADRNILFGHSRRVYVNEVDQKKNMNDYWEIICADIYKISRTTCPRLNGKNIVLFYTQFRAVWKGQLQSVEAEWGENSRVAYPSGRIH